mgnify:CR=1 FL=1
MSKILIQMMLLAGMISSGGAYAYTIDGNLSDWGISHNGNANDWTPNSGVSFFSVEDQSGSGAYYLNPGWGGQNYDAEAMYVAWDNSNLYIAVATGHNPNTSNTGGNYAVGDIAIDIGNNGSWDYGIELKGDAGLTQSHIYSSPSWAYGIWTNTGAYTSNPATADHAHPTSMISGSDSGLVSLSYTTSGTSGYGINATDLHYFYEVAVPLSSFGNTFGVGSQFNIHWTMNCANDAISVQGSRPPQNRIPEPGTLALLPLGMIGLAILRRRKSA